MTITFISYYTRQLYNKGWICPKTTLNNKNIAGRLSENSRNSFVDLQSQKKQ